MLKTETRQIEQGKKINE